MEVVYDDDALSNYMAAAIGVTPDRPILIDRFLQHALECEADAICDGMHAFVPAVMEHYELAGIHSGDSACILPSVNIDAQHLETIKDYTRKIAEAMHVCGLMNYPVCNRKRYGICSGSKSTCFSLRFLWFQRFAIISDGASGY